MVKTLPRKESHFKIEANDEQRKLLAERFNLEECKFLTATVSLRPIAGNADYVALGEFQSEIVQKSVISLDSLTQSIAGTVRRLYKDGVQPYEGDEILIDIEDDDPPDSIDNGAIDICELIAEEFGLSLDNFPREDGAEFGEFEIGTPEEPSETENPFAALKKLRDKMS